MRELMVVLSLTGCAIPTYHRPDTTQAQLDRDFCACIRNVGTVPDLAWLSAQVGMRDECMESKGYTREW